jgi:hypothetical protein
VCMTILAVRIARRPASTFPDEIRELMNQMNQPRLAHVLPSEETGGDDSPAS